MVRLGELKWSGVLRPGRVAGFCGVDKDGLGSDGVVG